MTESPSSRDDFPREEAATRRPDAFPFIYLAICMLYVVLQLSPSSYAFVFDQLGIERHGLVAGEPRWIRADEWNIHTPLIQIAVANGFERTNSTSIYGEDLRSMLPLPLLDWGLVFKPAFWGFFIESSFGYSLLHGLHILGLVLGFHLLFRRLGAQPSLAAAASLVVFFSGYIQFWWMHQGMMLAYLPWIPLILTSRVSVSRRFAMLLAAFTCMMFSTQFYPPLWVSIAAFGLVISTLTIEQRSPVVSFALLLTAGIVATSLVCLYQYSFITSSLEIQAMGGRRFDGGGVPWQIGASLLLPGLSIQGFEPLLAFHNICEASAIGSYLPLLALVFVDWRGIGSARRANRLLRAGPALLLAAATLYTLAWIHLPSVPWMFGAPLFWHQTWPQRLTFLPGLALTVMAVVALAHLGAKVTALRIGSFVAITLAAYHFGKEVLMGGDRILSSTDLAVVPALAITLAIAQWIGRRGGPIPVASAVAWAAAIANIALFAAFNPLQRATPLFDRPQEGLVPTLRAMQEAHPKKHLVVEGDWAASLNGYGFTPISAVFYQPPGPHTLDVLMHDVLGAWDVQPDIATGYVRVAAFARHPVTRERIERPAKSTTLANLLFVPIPDPAIEAEVRKPPIDALAAQTTGYLDGAQLTPDGHGLRLVGWRSKPGTILIETAVPAAVVYARSVHRPDVVRGLDDVSLWDFGYEIELRSPRPIELDELDSIRLFVDDPDRGPIPVARANSR